MLPLFHLNDFHKDFIYLMTLAYYIGPFQLEWSLLNLSVNLSTVCILKHMNWQSDFYRMIRFGSLNAHPAFDRLLGPITFENSAILAFCLNIEVWFIAKKPFNWANVCQVHAHIKLSRSIKIIEACCPTLDGSSKNVYHN